MDAAFLAALEAEAARLESELEHVPAYRSLKKIRSLQADYGINQAFDARRQMSADAGRNASTGKHQRTRANTQRTRVAVLAEAVFRETNRRFQSSALVPELESKGFVPAGSQNPGGAIASILSHHALFDNASDSHGVGYGLREWTDGNSADLLNNSYASNAEKSTDA